MNMYKKIKLLFIIIAIFFVGTYYIKAYRNNTSNLMMSNIEALAYPENGDEKVDCTKSQAVPCRYESKCPICNTRPYFSGTSYWCEPTRMAGDCQEGDSGYIYPCRCYIGQPPSPSGYISKKSCPIIGK